MEFENACSEMYYILEHMAPKDKQKIPESVIKFFRDNRSIFYEVNLDVTKNLNEQELKDETKAFIQIINEKYFANKTGEEVVHKHLEEKTDNNIAYEKSKEVIEQKALAIIKKENRIVTWFKNILRKIGMKY